jgi:hypothetical protein
VHLGSQGDSEDFERRRELQLQHERGRDEKAVIEERELAMTTMTTDDSTDSGGHDPRDCGDISLETMAFRHCENRPPWH